MANKTYKIVVLTELKDTISATLNSSVSLAKLINAEINLLCLENPTDVVKKDNQLSAMREINGKYTVVNKTLKTLTQAVAKDFCVPINYSFVVGQIKDEIKKYIKEQQPDIIVIGKRKSKLLKMAGGNLTKYILKYHPGTILITDESNTITPNKILNLGVLNGNNQMADIDLLKPLISQTQKPIKSFKIVDDLNATTDDRLAIDTETVEFVFGQNNNAIATLSNYLEKSNVNLLYIDRTKSKSNGDNMLKKDLNTMINELNVSLLLSAENHTSLA
ncbi:universal stress protein [Aestuariivivens insulae]|uniref:universal stress protein n=1 Tax=Aestuariivivens insulae TaxID=1621988 RepID=UPI001F55C0B3|nr:universal stress protein [Aestuariivivens insulae]